METFYTVFVSLGGGVILTKVVEAILDWAKGRHGKAQEGWRKFDTEATARRILVESLHEHRLKMIEANLELPDYPTYPKTD